jgi:PepSY-associated TM region
MAVGLWRALVVLHRYLGVAVGLLMALWFASGIVMMYVGFPRLTEAERLSAVSPVRWEACCRFGDLLPDGQPILRAQVENHLGEPALRLRRIGARDALVDLARGTFVTVDAEAARRVALAAAPRVTGHEATIVALDEVTTDQWTVGRYFRDRPLHRLDFDDPASTSVYVASTGGQIVLVTTATQRFWNWLGTIPHWLYFTSLRNDVALWSEVVIWASIVGTFLTVMGLVLGVIQFRRARSPYRGLFYWHHVAGLVFGIVTLTWVVSGLVSMNPWGFLESRGSGEVSLIQGTEPRWGEIKASLDALRAQPELARVVSLTTAPLGGRLYWLATRDDGSSVRLDASGHVAAPSEADLAGAATQLAGALGIAEQGLMSEEDAYYFNRRGDFVLPVYRVILNDDERTRYYLDPASGALLQRADANGRWHRWLFGGLHRLDFTAAMRARPFWDVLVLALMLGGLALSVTGCYLALRRVRADIGALFRRRGKMAPANTELSRPAE